LSDNDDNDDNGIHLVLRELQIAIDAATLDIRHINLKEESSSRDERKYGLTYFRGLTLYGRSTLV
jgi:hypothetical protein